MKCLMLLLALGLALSEKLDRTYLPPPGSKFAGGSLSAIDAPLEFPKETYSTTRPLLQGQKGEGILQGDSRLTVGVDRGSAPPGFPQDLRPVTPGSEPLKHFHKIPTTTTSYAFTQTTTFPPPEGFETTISPIGSAVPILPGIIPSFPQPGQIQPGFGQTSGQILQPGIDQQVNLVPTSGIPQQPGFPSSIPGQTFGGRPGVQSQSQIFNKYQQSQPSSTVSPITGIGTQPELPPQGRFDQYQGLNQHLGVQPPKHLIGQQGTFPSAPSTVSSSIPQVPQQYLPGTANKYGINVNNLQGVTPSSNIPTQLGDQSSTPIVGQQGTRFPPTAATQGPVYQPNFPQFNANVDNIQGTAIPGASVPRGGYLPGQQIQTAQRQPGIGADFVGSTTPGSVLSQAGYLPGQQIQTAQGLSDVGQIQPGGGVSKIAYQPMFGQQQYQISDGRVPQQYPVSSKPGVGNQYQSIDGRTPQKFSTTATPGVQGPIGDIGSQPFSTSPGFPSGIGQDTQDVYRPAATPSVLPPGYPSQPSYTGTTPSTYTLPGAPGDIYSAITPGDSSVKNLVIPSSPTQYTERPQAESDRNAVILNYENVLTPEGFAYSFDTSNGIHADESGTAQDGVKAVGSYSYTGDDGKVYNIVYSADENGFQPHGDHLPTPPPVPEAIQRVIEQATREKEAGISHDGSYDEDKYGHRKYQRPKTRYRPETQDRIIEDGAHEYKNVQDELEDKKYITQGSRKPITSKDDIIDDYEEDITNEQYLRGGPMDDNQKKQTKGRIPARYPSNEQDQDDYSTFEDGKNIQDSRHRQPTKSRIDDKNVVSPGKKYTYDMRPVAPGRKPGMSNKSYVGSQEQVSVEYEDDSQELPTGLGQEKTSGRPKGTKYPGTTSTKYIESVDSTSRPNIDDDGTRYANLDDYSKSGEPKKSKRPGFSSSKFDKDQSRPHQPESTEEFGGDDENIPVSIKPDQKGTRRPALTRPVDSKFSQKMAAEESGYQYLPPRDKFPQGDNSKIPSRLPGPSTKQPFSKYDTSDTKTTIEPFMTPNVSREDEIDEEDYIQQVATIPSRKPGKPTYYGTRVIPSQEKESDYYNNDQDIDDERTPTKIVSVKPGTTKISSSRRPPYKPSSRVTSRPQQGGTDGKISQTDLSTEEPEELRYSDDTSKTPGRTFISSTTPMPSQALGHFTPSSSQTKSKYPITYQSIDGTTTNEYPDRTVTPGSDTSNIPSGRPGITLRPGTTISSSRPTSRPTSDYYDRTTISQPATIRTGFNVPLDNRPPGTITYPNLPENTSIITPGSYRPDTTTKFLTRPGITQVQNVPSTTYRPNYIITDKSQPAQFVNLDKFGRPIPTGQPALTYGTTYRPDYAVTGLPGLPTGKYQESVPGQFPGDYRGVPAQSYKPQSDRLGKPEIGSTQIPYGSQRPDDIVPISGQVPSYVPAYRGQTSTERIIGEDFSGPKQPQRFDPETGYHY